MSEELARAFHEVYERLAPEYGYETRSDTKAFNPDSPNGRLMIAVCDEVAGKRIQQLESERDALVEAAQRVLSRAYKLGRMDNIWVQDVLEPVLLKENDNG